MTVPSTARSAVVTLLAVLALAACAAPPSVAPATAGASPHSAASSEGGAPAPSATYDAADAPEHLRFAATTIDGQPFDGASLYGHPTILWFWAPWCPVCQGEAPGIVAALGELPEGVHAIGVPGRSDTAAMRAFLDDYGFGDMPQIVDADGSLWSAFGVTSQPAVAIIAADGTVTTLPGAGGKAGFLEAAASIAP